MPHPVNISNALPTALEPLPPNASGTVDNALPDPDPTPVNTLDSLPDQDPDYHPVRILNALPITRTPPTPPSQVAVAIADVLAQFGWSGFRDSGATQVFFPDIWTTFDEPDPFDDSDYAEATLYVNSGTVYIFQITGLVDPGVTSGFSVVMRTIRTGTTGVYNLIVAITNFPGDTFFTRTITDAQLRGNGGINDWVFPLTALEVADIVTYGTLRPNFSTAGGPAGGDAGAIRIPQWKFLIPQP